MKCPNCGNQWTYGVVCPKCHARAKPLVHVPGSDNLPPNLSPDEKLAAGEVVINQKEEVVSAILKSIWAVIWPPLKMALFALLTGPGKRLLVMLFGALFFLLKDKLGLELPENSAEIIAGIIIAWLLQSGGHAAAKTIAAVKAAPPRSRQV